MLWKSLLAALLATIATVSVTMAIGAWRMRARVERELAPMVEALTAPDTTPIDLDAYTDLPAPVRRYLVAAGVDGHAPVNFVHLRHGGTFSTDNGETWLPVRADEYFTADPPAFLWSAAITMVPGVPARVRDRYAAGAGSMLVTLGGVLTMDEVTGPRLSTASLLRYLGELPVFPTAMLPGEGLSWEAVDSASARVTFRDAGMEVSGVYHFGQDGMPARFTATRYRTEGGDQVQRPWEGWYRDYRDMDGLRVPGSFGVTWIVDGEPAPYARFELDTVVFGVRGGAARGL